MEIGYLFWDIFIPAMVTGVLITYPVAKLSDIITNQRLKTERHDLEIKFGRRRLYIIQDKDEIYYRRLSIEQTQLLEAAITYPRDDNTDIVSIDDTTVCQLILSCVSATQNKNGKRNLVNSPLSRISKRQNQDFEIDLDVLIS
jgi:hypothetical protein